MELRAWFMHSFFCIVVFAIAPARSVNYDAQLGHGLKYNSVPKMVKQPNVDQRTLQQGNGDLPTGFPMKSGQIVTRCTTSKPLPKLNPYYLPSSDDNDDKSNLIGSGDEGRLSDFDHKGNNNTYIAPVPGRNPLHYIDDEK